MTKSVQVEIGDQVYAGKSTEAFGGVRAVHEHDLIVDIEGKGDVKIPAAAVEAVHDHKVVVTVHALPPEIREAIAHAHEQETQ
jgi:hypothetical protein